MANPHLQCWRQVGTLEGGRAVMFLPLKQLDRKPCSEADLVSHAQALAEACGCNHDNRAIWVLDATGASDQKSSNPSVIRLLFPDALMESGICLVPNNFFQRGLLAAKKQHAHLERVRVVKKDKLAGEFPEIHAAIQHAT